MTLEDQRWPWFRQIVDATSATLGAGIVVVMVFRDRWPVVGVVTALVLLGRITATKAIEYLLGRWEQKP